MDSRSGDQCSTAGTPACRARRESVRSWHLVVAVCRGRMARWQLGLLGVDNADLWATMRRSMLKAAVFICIQWSINGDANAATKISKQQWGGVSCYVKERNCGRSGTDIRDQTAADAVNQLRLDTDERRGRAAADAVIVCLCVLLCVLDV